MGLAFLYFISCVSCPLVIFTRSFLPNLGSLLVTVLVFNSDIFQNEKQATPMVKTNTVTTNEPKLGRNDLVKITNGQDTQEMKYKKAKPMIESGEWRLS